MWSGVSQTHRGKKSPWPSRPFEMELDEDRGSNKKQLDMAQLVAHRSYEVKVLR
jgi:hypothetical protein